MKQYELKQEENRELFNACQMALGFMTMFQDEIKKNKEMFSYSETLNRNLFNAIENAKQRYPETVKCDCCDREWMKMVEREIGNKQ